MCFYPASNRVPMNAQMREWGSGAAEANKSLEFFVFDKESYGFTQAGQMTESSPGAPRLRNHRNDTNLIKKVMGLQGARPNPAI